MAKITTERAKRAQRALLITFFTQGIAGTTIIPRVPELIDQIGVSFVAWGAIIGFSGLGSLLPLIFTNRLVAKYGTQRVIRVSTFGVIAAIALMPWITNPGLFFLLMMLQAFSFSTFNISLNAQAVMFQKKLGKVLLAKFHGAWSIGAMSSVAVSGILAGFMPLTLHLSIVAVALFAAFSYGNGGLLKADEDGHKADAERQVKVSWLKSPAFLWVLSLGLFAGMWPELVVMDWSAVFAKQVLGVGKTAGAIPYVVFVGAMIVVRLSISRITKKVHISTLSKWGGIIGSITMMAGVLLSSSLAATDQTLAVVALCTLWAISGLGMGSMVPSFYSAAGHVKGLSTAQALSRMSLANALMIMGAKYIMGALAQVDLITAMIFPVASFFIAGVISGIVAKTSKQNEAAANAFPPTGPISVVVE